MSTIITKPGENGEFVIFTKGASEMVLSLCTKYSKNGNVAVLDATTKRELSDAIERYAEFGLRTICIAYRELEPNTKDLSIAPESDLTCLAIVGIKDPVRDEVPFAVRQCQSAGITVRMVTGDNIQTIIAYSPCATVCGPSREDIVTAKQIAKECGIYNPDKGGVVMEGPAFRKLSPEQMDRVVPDLQVLARSSPSDKYILVSKLKQLGEVVAATGDGTNDSIALKEAHVGFSMGITGTEVCKEASDIVLMDDNFSSIVKAVMWGRNVYDSIRKVAVSVAFVGAITNEHGESPLKPVQLLWVNLIMDTMAALALATESPTPELLEREPYLNFFHNDTLITKQMWRNIIGQALYQFIISMSMLYFGPAFFGVEKDSVHHLTLIFNTFVMCQVFNEINSRKLGRELNAFSGVFTNKVFVGVMLFTVIAQVLMVQFGGEFVGTTPLNAEEWLFCLAIGAGGLPLGVFLLQVEDLKKRASAGLLLRSIFAAPIEQKIKRSPKSPSSAAALRRWGKVKTATKTLGIVNAMKRSPTLSAKLRRRHRVPVVGQWNSTKSI